VGLGVAGGIGAYKAVEAARLLQRRGHDVHVVMTRNARRFVGPLTFEAITRHPVITSQFTPGLNASIEHIDLASTIDLLLVAPATANMLGKFAHGIADDFLSSLYLATRAPVVMAPSMNTHMWEHPAVRDNVATLAARGVQFIEPGSGYLACGWIGTGRLAEPDTIADAVDRVLRPRQSLAGRRVLVTAGPTYEDLDPVRFIGNRSSGRMGFALAAAARARGADVTVIAGPTTVDPPPAMDVIRVRSAREMHGAVIDRAAGADVVIMAAAVADYTRRGGVSSQKMDREGPIALDLEPTPDILGELGRQRGDRRTPVLIGFAAQSGAPGESARRKLGAKGADLIVANDISAPGSGFDVETNQALLVSREGIETLPLLTKVEVAGIVLDRVEQLLAGRPVAAGR
jgi:phosphopantothenoylcysteine decarboxylase/phosphopantothenate--cysteine ligase